MKLDRKIKWFRLRCFWTSAAFFLFWVGRLPSEELFELKIAVGPWLPYNAGHGGEITPFESKIKKLLERNGGFKISYVRCEDWEQAMNAVRKGTAYLTLPWIYTKDRTAEFQYSAQPVLLNYNVLFTTTQNAPRLASFFSGKQEQFNQLRIARIKAYALWNQELLRKNNFKNIIEFDTTLDAFVALEDGRVDFVSENLFVGYGTLLANEKLDPGKHTFFPVFYQSSFPPDGRQMYILAKKKQFSDPIIQRIDHLLQTFRSEFPLEAGDVRRVEPLLPEVIKIIATSLPDGTNGGAVHELDAKGLPSSKEIILPIGTKGISLAWSADLSSLNAQIINGPFRGKVVKIPVQQLEIGEKLDISFMTQVMQQEEKAP